MKIVLWRLLNKCASGLDTILGLYFLGKGPTVEIAHFLFPYFVKGGLFFIDKFLSDLVWKNVDYSK